MTSPGARELAEQLLELADEERNGHAVLCGPVMRLAAEALAMRAASPVAVQMDIEAISRRAFPATWAKIDANIADDDWNGGAALNLRDVAMRDVRSVLAALPALPAQPPAQELIMCDECGKYPADLPSKICPGCEAYREHTGQP